MQWNPYEDVDLSLHLKLHFGHLVLIPIQKLGIESILEIRHPSFFVKMTGFLRFRDLRLLPTVSRRLSLGGNLGPTICLWSSYGLAFDGLFCALVF